MIGILSEDKVFSFIKRSKIGLTKEAIFKKFKKKLSKKDINKYINSLKSSGKVLESKNKIMSLSGFGNILSEIISQSKTFSFAKSLEGDKHFFISKEHLNGALAGDKVIISRIRESEKGLSGVVERIVKPGKHTFLGRVVKDRNCLKLELDSYIKCQVSIENLNSVKVREGDKVKVCVLKRRKNTNFCAKILKVYGKANSARVCTDAILDINEIPCTFPKKVLDQAKKVASSRITDVDLEERVDFREKIVFTIDAEDAKDLDDAISIQKLEDGWELGVHIADVSHYVKPGTDLDKEASFRGTSVYLADRVIPMLPESISNGICSLDQGEDKLTFSVIIKLNENAEVVNYNFVKSIINSKVRGVYEEINNILAGKADENLYKKYQDILKHIKWAKQLSDILTKKSENRGVMDISTLESNFFINEFGKCTDISLRTQGESEKIIENFMIIANTLAARHAKNLNFPFVYRVHEKPDLEKVRQLSKLVNILGMNASKIRKDVKPSDLSDLIDQAKKNNLEKIISKKILQTMAKARYSQEPLGHFGLSLGDYCHFTSPIRRYPDICVHRILFEIISKNSLEKVKNKYNLKIKESAKHSTLCEVRAMKVERDTGKYYMAEFVSQHIGKIFDGVISGATSRGIFVELGNGVSGFMDLACYEGFKFEFDGISKHVDKIRGKKLCIGEKIRVKVASVNIESALIDFSCI